VSRLYQPFLLAIALLLMSLAVCSVPFPGSLIFVAAVALGAVWAASRIRDRERRTRE
jgi:hypothetical protein